MIVYAWLFATAIIFTAFGFVWGRSSGIARIIEATVDSLIADGFLKTRGHGENEELIPWREWESK